MTIGLAIGTPAILGAAVDEIETQRRAGDEARDADLAVVPTHCPHCGESIGSGAWRTPVARRSPAS